MPEALVESGADLISDTPSDVFDSAGADPVLDTPSDAPAEVETIETPAGLEGDEAPPEETPTEEEPQQTEAEPEAKKKAAQTEELPEGVVAGKDRNGKPGLFVEDARWKTIYGNHQLVQKVSELLGEPATPEALQLRHEAYMAQERMFGDLNSGDQAQQSNVVNYVLEEMNRARQDGEVGVNPAVPFAEAVYDGLRRKSEDGYATLRMHAARDLVEEMFNEAASNGYEDLTFAAQHFAKTLAKVPPEVKDLNLVRKACQRFGIPFYAKGELSPEQANNGRHTDFETLRNENERLNSIVNGNPQASQAAQFDTWFQATAQTVKGAILDEAIKPALVSVADAWKKYPNDYQDLVVDRLHRKVTETIRADAGFTDGIKLLNDQARRAVSAQRRTELAQAIQQRYVNRAKLAVDAVKKPILEFAANRLKEQADQLHARRTAAQNHTTPKGSAGQVPRSLMPKGLPEMRDGIYDPAVAMEQAKRLFPA